MRGLKPLCPQTVKQIHSVAPRTGAWIETFCMLSRSTSSSLSHPARVRGLKHKSQGQEYCRGWSHPARVRGLKRIHHSNRAIRTMSHPARVRGLKQVTKGQQDILFPSHPARVRGLKQIPSLSKFYNIFVAPRTGAWIETGRTTS